MDEVPEGDVQKAPPDQLPLWSVALKGAKLGGFTAAAGYALYFAWVLSRINATTWPDIGPIEMLTLIPVAFIKIAVAGVQGSLVGAVLLFAIALVRNMFGNPSSN